MLPCRVQLEKEEKLEEQRRREVEQGGSMATTMPLQAAALQEQVCARSVVAVEEDLVAVKLMKGKTGDDRSLVTVGCSLLQAAMSCHVAVWQGVGPAWAPGHL